MTESERGTPRTQYERTYVLLPQDADASWAHAVVDATWNDERYTFGSSADDSAIGDLDVRRVIAVNPHQWPGDLAAFYEEWYPGIELIVVEASTPKELHNILVGDKPEPPSDLLLWQCDPRWKDIQLAGTYCTATLCKQGCYVACLAMAQRFYGIDPDATPETANATLGPTGFSGCDVRWSESEARLGIEIIKKTYSHTEAITHLATGNVMMAEISPTTYQHFVLVTRHADGRFWMLDPYRNVEGWLDEQYPGVDSWRLLCAVGIVPAPKPPPSPSSFPLRGVHDRAGGDWLRANQLQGWCLLPVYVGTSWRDLNLDPLADAGIRCLVNLRFSYAVDDHGAGTMPRPDELAVFKRACLDTMARNPRAHAFVICNEMNNPREWPRDFTLTPAYYRNFYQGVYEEKPPGAQVWPGSIDPFNAGWGDWRVVWQEVLASIELDGVALHGYTHGPDPQLIWHEKRFTHPPLIGVYYDLRVVETQLSIIPIQHRNKEMVVTETNHYVRRDGSVGWEADAGLWVSQAYSYFATLGIDGACLFRHNYDQWNYSQYPMILEALTTSSKAT